MARSIKNYSCTIFFACKKTVCNGVIYVVALIINNNLDFFSCQLIKLALKIEIFTDSSTVLHTNTFTLKK